MVRIVTRGASSVNKSWVSRGAAVFALGLIGSPAAGVEPGITASTIVMGQAAGFTGSVAGSVKEQTDLGIYGHVRVPVTDRLLSQPQGNFGCQDSGAAFGARNRRTMGTATSRPL